MKRKVVRIIGLVVFILLLIATIFNVYKWIVSGKQEIKISTFNKAYTNSDLYISVVAQKNGEELETKTKIKLLDANGKKVKKVKTSISGNDIILKIPEIEPGNYNLEAVVSSKAGKDKIKKGIYITDGNLENTFITFDKGIYKPGDTINYRALLTSKENDTPVVKDVNVSIYDGNDNRVYNEDIKTSEYGIISGSFKLADEVNSGVYKLVVKSDAVENTKQFKVNPYITPKYEVKIEYDKQNYLVDDTATISIQGKYFFGEAVSDAKYIVFIDGQKYQEVTANEEGIANVSYKITKAKKYNVKVEAVDSSNYYVEATSQFTAGTDIFEIEFLPEHGDLIKGRNNEVYVFTSTADGQPVKTYITVSSEQYTKQIVTDENGIGKFIINIDDSTNDSLKLFYVSAQNMEEETVSKKILLNITDTNLLVSTDKVKYSQGDDINLKISSLKSNTKNIYFFKGGKPIKMISTDLAETTVNLDDTYGLIDIYVTEGKNNNTGYYYDNGNISTLNTCKRTIFIKPTKSLNIGISTDKEEYKPGDAISISFNTTDEGKQNVEAALLVSMIDNSILSLAQNDLSIDNIKLALQDISFSDELDAETLYSCIIDDASEETMTALLLRQQEKDISVDEKIMNNRDASERAKDISILLIIALVLMVLIYISIRFPKVKDIIKHVINFAMFYFIVVQLTYVIIDEYFWRINFELLACAITFVMCLAIYIAWVSRISKKIFRTSLSIIIGTILYALLMVSLFTSRISGIITLIILGIIILAAAILSRIYKNKDNKFMKKAISEVAYIAKFILAVIVGVFIGGTLEALSDIYDIGLPIALICIYILNYLLNRKSFEKTDEKTSDTNKNPKKPIVYYIVIALAIIGIIAIGHLVIERFTHNRVYDYSPTFDLSDDWESSTSSSNRTGTTDIGAVINEFDSADYSSSDISGVKSSSVLSIFDGADKYISKSAVAENNVQTVNNQLESVTDDNIRNVFLESMCFIPELVTSGGNASVNFKVSDNITTWTIQTVGNTKDGRIGYSILDNVKVFKEFFADFELPNNLVETDIISIPVTVYNYTDEPISTVIKINQEEWFLLEENNIPVNVDAQNTKMVYVPITIIKHGNYKFRVEVNSNDLTDIIEKEAKITPNGYKVEKVVSSGVLEDDISEDILILDEILEGTAKAKVKIYASAMSQTVEGMENIFRMPTGCFEQISSSLYPNILALKYMQDKGIVNEELKAKAIGYISSGYQKLLTYEVSGEKGGYSLYGHFPAETVLTAYGLMEISDLKNVYKVDDSVINNMTEFLYKKQKSDGSFTITGYHVGGAGSSDELSLNAYIIWALSESNPTDKRLDKSVDYLKGKLDKITDNYTLALVANVLANTKDKETDNVIKRLVNNTEVSDKEAYLKVKTYDYYGTGYNYQTVQTVALTSMALSKTSNNNELNKKLINYLIGKKDPYGTWHSTQATILALKALNELNDKSKIDNQTISVKINDQEKQIEIQDNPLDIYEVSFDSLAKENKLNIDLKKGNACYEVVQEYYIPYEKVDILNNKIGINVDFNNNLSVNDILNANIVLTNRSDNTIQNGMVTINIPQGFTTIEDSLMLLEAKGIIEKYETNYRTVNIYLRNFDAFQIATLNVEFRAMYPVEITGMGIRAYDYYNPDIEGNYMPSKIIVN